MIIQPIIENDVYRYVSTTNAYFMLLDSLEAQELGANTIQTKSKLFIQTTFTEAGKTALETFVQNYTP